MFKLFAFLISAFVWVLATIIVRMFKLGGTSTDYHNAKRDPNSIRGGFFDKIIWFFNTDKITTAFLFIIILFITFVLIVATTDGDLLGAMSRLDS